MKTLEAEKRFIEDNLQHTPAQLALILSKRTDLNKEYILNQVNGIQKAAEKLPFLINIPNYEFPSSRAVAQASSMRAAEFKASLLSESYQVLADLSGGMGIDSYFLSKGRKKLLYLEPEPHLFKISKHNFKVLEANNINCLNMTANDFINSTEEKFDLIYLDPDRRKAGQRLILLEDCEPNVLEIQEQLLELSKELMIKFSPLLDIKLAMQQLIGLKEVVVLSIKNEVKELLFRIEKGWKNEPLIRAIDLGNDQRSDFTFTYAEEVNFTAEYSSPSRYLYEPNAAIMKAGAFNLVAETYKLKKIAPNTHLYTSTDLISEFPGRILKILKVDKSPKIAPKKVNLVNRNAGMSVAEMKKKFKLKDGGNLFLYACRLLDGKRVLVLCEKV